MLNAASKPQHPNRLFRPKFILLAIAIGLVAFGATKCALWLPQFIIEFDGARTLENGYQLSMLKGFPRLICTPSSVVIYPDPEANREVDKYAVHNPYIIATTERFWGSNRGTPTKPFFVVDTRTSKHKTFDTRAELDTFLKDSGIDPEHLDWER